MSGPETTGQALGGQPPQAVPDRRRAEFTPSPRLFGTEFSRGSALREGACWESRRLKKD